MCTVGPRFTTVPRNDGRGRSGSAGSVPFPEVYTFSSFRVYLIVVFVLDCLFVDELSRRDRIT